MTHSGRGTQEMIPHRHRLPIYFVFHRIVFFSASVFSLGLGRYSFIVGNASLFIDGMAVLLFAPKSCYKLNNNDCSNALDIAVLRLLHPALVLACSGSKQWIFLSAITMKCKAQMSCVVYPQKHRKPARE